jgi:hypothetical protein
MATSAGSGRTSSKQHPGARRLPAVLPIVLHHGEQGWTAATDLHELFDVSPEILEAARDYLPRLRFVLDDLARIDESELFARSLTALGRAALLLFRNARRRAPDELRADLARWIDTFREVFQAPNGFAAFRALMRYTLLVNEIPTDEVRDYARQLGPAAAEAVVTTGEQLIAQGRTEIVLKQLGRRFGPLSADAQRRVQSASPEELDVMADRVLTAETLEEVLQ